MPESWTAVTWGEVAEKEIFKVATTSLMEKRVAGVLSAGRGMFDRGPLDEFDTNYEFFHEVRSGQLVVRKLTAWEGPITVVTPEFDGFVCSPEFPTFTLDANRLAPSYARLLCQRPDFWSQILGVSTGSVLRRKRVSPAALLSLPIVLPPLAEQRRIVDVVGSIDSYISALEDQLGATRNARAALLYDLLSHPGDDWEETTLGEVSEVTVGPAFKSEVYRSCSDGIPLVRGMNLGPDGLRWDETFCWPRSGLEGLERYLLLAGQTVVAMDATFTSDGVIRAGLVDSAHLPLLLNQRVASVSAGSSILHAFVHLIIKSPDLRSFLRNRQTGAFAPHISKKDLTKFPFSLPPLVEQRRIVDVVGSFDVQVEALQSQVEAARRLRSGVLSELLSGERLLDESYDVVVGL